MSTFGSCPRGAPAGKQSFYLFIFVSSLDLLLLHCPTAQTEKKAIQSFAVNRHKTRFNLFSLVLRDRVRFNFVVAVPRQCCCDTTHSKQTSPTVGSNRL